MFKWLFNKQLKKDDDENDDVKSKVTENNQIAIIGGGMGGCFSAYFLREIFPLLNIHLFEKKKIGGRARHFEYNNETYELGAGMAYNGNQYLRDYSNKLKLERKKLKLDNYLHIFNGSEFVYTQNSFFFPINIWNAFWRYGPYPLSFGRMTKGFLKNFNRIYDAQEKGIFYERPEEILKLWDMYDFTQKDIKTFIKEEYGESKRAERFANEVIGCINKSIYNQGMNLHAFTGLVSFLPITDNNLFCIKGGYEKLAQKLLDESNTKVYTSDVKKIKKEENGLFKIDTLENKSKRKIYGPYDCVILAAPLENSDITYEGFEMPYIPKKEFKRTVTTYLTGRIKPEYFKVKKLIKKVEICSTGDSTFPISNISYKDEIEKNKYLYKVSSSQKLDDKLINEMFENVDIIKIEDWDAYPLYVSPEQFSPFKLTDGLYYNNAIETIASAMEMSIIAAKNSTLLVKQFFKDKN